MIQFGIEVRVERTVANKRIDADCFEEGDESKGLETKDARADEG
jgi:hypothetical protein